MLGTARPSWAAVRSDTGDAGRFAISCGAVHTSGIYGEFRSGNGQAARLPKQFRLNSEEVEIFRRGDEIILREKDGTTVRAFDLLADLPDDFDLTAAEREKDRPQKRNGP